MPTRLSWVTTEVTIREAETADFDAWFDLFEHVASEGRWIGAESPLRRPSMQRRFEHLLRHDAAVLLLADAGGQLIGALSIEIQGGCAELGVMVGDGFRGGALGSALMDACLAWCRQRDVHKITATVWPHNERALALFHKYGFSAEGRLVRHYRRRNGELWDAIPMGLVLDATAPGSPYEDART